MYASDCEHQNCSVYSEHFATFFPISQWWAQSQSNSCKSNDTANGVNPPTTPTPFGGRVAGHSENGNRDHRATVEEFLEGSRSDRWRCSTEQYRTVIGECGRGSTTLRGPEGYTQKLDDDNDFVHQSFSPRAMATSTVFIFFHNSCACLSSLQIVNKHQSSKLLKLVDGRVLSWRSLSESNNQWRSQELQSGREILTGIAVHHTFLISFPSFHFFYFALLNLLQRWASTMGSGGSKGFVRGGD